MFTHSYERCDHNTSYHRETCTGFNKAPVLIIFTILIILVVAQKMWINSYNTTEADHANNYKLWNKFQTDKLSEIDLLKTTSANLLMKYENLQCSTRGLIITKVKGITLCMHPETKALHKIDNEDDK